jgi:hypothetical protein
MTTFILKHALVKAINNLNYIIDEKISRGRSYAKEAQLHKRLVSKLRQLERGAHIAAVL